MPKVTRQNFLGIAGVGSLALAAVPHGLADDGSDGQPNILFIMADDHCLQAMGCYGSKTMKTPHLDRLAQQGMRFTHMTATNSLCAPSRAVLLTGKYSHINGLRSNGIEFDGSQQTFPKLLKEVGYETAIVGKWHLKTEPQGFDYYNVMPGQGRFIDCPLKEKGKPWTDGGKGGTVHKGYLTDVISNISIDWLDNHRNRQKPFCLMVHHKAPHGPHDPAPRHRALFKDETIPEPPTLLDDYSGRAPETIQGKLQSSRMAICRYPQYREEIARFKGDHAKATRHMYQAFMKGYLRLVASLDENVGRLLDHLDQSGLSRNTVVIYTSDNGFFNGEHGFFNKMWMYEPSLHMPLLVRHPGLAKQGSKCDELISMVDMAPTILDLAGARIPKDMQGASIKPLLQGKNSTWRDAVYYHYYKAYNVPEQYGVRTRTHKLVYYPKLDEKHRWELFDLQKDPQEMHNLHNMAEHRQIAMELRATFRSLIRQYRDIVSIE